jgi:hypothetical protein
MIPMEMISLLGGTLVGGIMKLWGMKQQAQADQQKMLMQKAGMILDDRAATRSWNNEGIQFTRRIIALSVVFSVIVLPKFMHAFFGVPILYGAEEIDKGFLFFTSDTSKTVWHELKGIPITPIDIHSTMAIIGLYFGGSLVGKKH